MNAAAPTYLIPAGLGDLPCRSTAQVDWWLSHSLFGTSYTSLPFRLQVRDETLMLEHAAGLADGDAAAVRYLHRVLHRLLCERAPSRNTTRPTSRRRLPHDGASTHRIFALDAPPRVEATRIDEPDMIRRCGAENAGQCLVEWQKKALTTQTAAAFNDKLASIWPELRAECLAFMLRVERMQRALQQAGGPTSAAEFGLDVTFYREAVVHAREMRNRYSVLDLLADAGILEDAVADER